MIKLFPILSLIFLPFVFSCESTDVNTEKAKLKDLCSSDNPTEELAWLKQEIQSIKASALTEYFYVEQADLMGEPVFILGNCCPFCNTIIPLYNCEGEIICYLSDCPSIASKIKNNKVIWKSDDNMCNF